MDMDQIYRTYERMVYQFLYMRTHDAHWSQDLLQETFLRAVTSISRYDGSCKLSVWLCQIARHVLWQELRKRGKTDFAELADSIPDPGNPDAETQVLQSEDRVGLYRAIHRLSEKEREVVLYRITGELSFREIGEILEKSENWARTTFYRAKLRLREELKANERNDRP
ncbi:MAG: sigma-70 family RNA polymerase sigma factor [Lachnospiraceae bacterium]|nr:sigma-70 family RNA polymerase sigma factor [Lachnospiraceae bacterium]